MRTLMTSAIALSALTFTPLAAVAAGNGEQNQTDASTATSAEVGVEQNRQDMTETEANVNADESSDVSTSVSSEQTASAEAFLKAQKNQQALSEAYLGAPVYLSEDDDEDSVGEIDSLIFSENGEIYGAVVDVGGFLGLGEKPVGIKWSALTEERQQDAVVFTAAMTRAELEDAPEYRTVGEQARDTMATEEADTQNADEATTD